ncbi:MAG TPA: cupredoxin domain-containing protein [Nitrososphaerales archaeon]|nr:cupredoxin domain-containing protein [Nitrososphaerales archaeon]
METDEHPGPPRGLLLSLGIIGIILGAAIAGEFVLRLQPQLGGGNTSVSSGSVVMPSGVGSNTALNFSPATITLIIGLNNTVTFSNRDTAIHTVTATDNSFNSGDITAGKSWTNTFTTAGNFTYYCVYHTSWMKGKVVVKSGIPNSFTVKILPNTGSDSSLNYNPSTLNLVVGVNNTVVFLNQDSVVHTVTSNDGTFDSGDIHPGMPFIHTFAAGTYSFHCTYHSYMKGTITVKSS